MIVPAAVARLARHSVLSGHRSARRSPLWVLLLAASSIALLFYVSAKERFSSIVQQDVQDQLNGVRSSDSVAPDSRSNGAYPGSKLLHVRYEDRSINDPSRAASLTARALLRGSQHFAPAAAVIVNGHKVDETDDNRQLDSPLLRAVLAADHEGQSTDGAPRGAGTPASVPPSLLASWKQYLLAHKNDSKLLAEEASKVIPNLVGGAAFYGNGLVEPLPVVPIDDIGDSLMPDKDDQQDAAPPTKCDNLDKAYEQLYAWRAAAAVQSPPQDHQPLTQLCPLLPSHLVGNINVFRCSESIEDLGKLDFHVEKGGYYRPEHCLPRSKAAVIVPFRNRWPHLSAFLLNMHPYLQKQQLEYTIYVVNQVSDGMFNKGILLNTGAAMATQLGQHDCFIFHDVDLYPENDLNLYRCPKGFLHLSVAVDKFDYKLPYKFLVGGALAVNRSAFEKINGYSNLYFGWGGEDDDLAGRIDYHGFAVKRHLKDVGSYSMMKHRRDNGNEKNPDRFHLLQDAGQRSEYEGLRSNVSRVTGVLREKLFTFINVTFDREHVIRRIHEDMLAAM